MLVKLIAYDLKSSMKYYANIFIVLVCMFVSSFLCSLLKIDFLNNLVFGLATLVTMLSIIGYFIISFTRIYSQMCGGESYFTYMIPASTGKTVLSKVLSVLITGVAVIVLLACYWLVLVMLITPNADIFGQVSAISESINPILPLMAAILIFIFFVGLLLMPLSCAVSCLPSIRNRNGGLVALVLSYIILIQLSVAITAAIWAVIFLLSGGELSRDFLVNPDNLSFTITSVRDVLFGCTAGFCVLFYTGSVYIFHKRRSI